MHSVHEFGFGISSLRWPCQNVLLAPTELRTSQSSYPNLSPDTTKIPASNSKPHLTDCRLTPQIWDHDNSPEIRHGPRAIVGEIGKQHQSMSLESILIPPTAKCGSNGRIIGTRGTHFWVSKPRERQRLSNLRWATWAFQH